MSNYLSYTEILATQEEAFKRLPKGERHLPLFGLGCTAYRAGHDTEKKLVEYLTKVYEQCEGGADYVDIANTAPSVISRLANEEPSGETAPRKPVGRPAKITDEEREAWQRWTAGILATATPLFDLGSQVEECHRCADDGYRYKKQEEALKAILGVDESNEYYYWFGDLYDRGTSEFRREVKNLDLIYMDCRNEYFCPNPLRTLKRDKTASVRVDYLLLEIDEPLAPIAAEKKSEEWLNEMFNQQSRFWSYIIQHKLLPVRSIVQSGGKSLHVLVPIAKGDPAMLDAENPQAKGFRARLKRLYALFMMDTANISSCGKTRTPWGERVVDDKFCMVQSLEFLDTDAKPISLEDFAKALEKIASEFLPKTNEKKIFCEKSFSEYLEGKGAELWYDDISRRPVAEGFRLNNLNNIATEVMDDWRELHSSEVGADKVRLYVNREVAKNTRNPALEWINGKKWDGQDRIKKAIDCLGNSLTPLEKTLARKWLMQTVGMLHNGEGGYFFGAEGVLTLLGKQGIGKTSWFRLLFPEERNWFREGAGLDVENKDSQLQLTQFWALELGEVDDTTKRDQSRLKALITAPTDTIRQPYQEHAETTPRHCSICASVNREDYLRDETGNRRWWTVRVEKIDWRAMQSLDRQQLWAQCESVWQDAGKEGRNSQQALFRLEESERKSLEDINQECVQEAGWEAVIEAKFPDLTSGKASSLVEMSLDKILDKIWSAPFNPSQRDRNDISKSLLHLGATRKKTKAGWRWSIPMDDKPF